MFVTISCHCTSLCFDKSYVVDHFRKFCTTSMFSKDIFSPSPATNWRVCRELATTALECTKHTNIILSTIPYRLDWDTQNYAIYRHNVILHQIGSTSSHVKLLNLTALKRSYFTSQCLHLSKPDKMDVAIMDLFFNKLI